MSGAGAAAAARAATTMTTSARPGQTCNSGSFDPFEALVNQRYTSEMARALGRYELLRPLARGGMAEVFLARRRAAGVEKWLVVKRIRAERAGDARFLDLFVREARLSMSLAHQNIVPVFDFGRIDEQVFLAMERVEGRDLGSSLARAGEAIEQRIPALVAAFIAEQALHALDYAHKRRGDNGTLLGIVHRDVTPRNVLLSWSGEVKLTDFGIAALAGEHAESRMIGTPAYMAPEQARGEPTDVRTDLYAVGLILREMLSGMRARPGDDREAVVAMARKAELVPWTGDAPPALRDIVERACAAEPSGRFASASEMLAAVDAFIVGERAEKRGESPARLLTRWLEDVWKLTGDSRELEHAGDSGDIEGNHLVSFMDDGELGVVGTGTVRSMAATADEPAAPTASGKSKLSDAAVQSAPSPQLTTAPIESMRWRLPAMAMAGLLVVGVVWFATRSDRSPAAPAEMAETQPPPRGSASAPAPPSLPTEPTPTPSPTPNPNPTPTPNPPPTPTVVVVRPTRSLVHTPAMPVIHIAPTQPTTATPPPAAPRFRGTINVKGSWAYFRVDNDPTQRSTPDNDVELTAGTHDVHLWNPETGLKRDAVIDVPAKPEWTWAEKLTP
jgi:eukaryotic-like serine/threonine-protein kinase